MAKKIVLMIVSLLVFLYTAGSFTAHAYVHEEILEISELFSTWELRDNNGTYYVESNRILNKADTLEISLGTTFTSSTDPDSEYNMNDFIVRAYGGITSKLVLWSSVDTIHQLGSFAFTYESPEATEFLFLDDGLQNYRVSFDHNLYYSVMFILNPNLTATQRARVLDVMNQGGNFYDIEEVYFFDVRGTFTREYIDPTLPEDLAKLPETIGSIYSDVEQMAEVSHSLDGNRLILEITYDQIYQVEYILAEGTDLSLFTDSYEAFYYTHEGEKFIVFNRGTESMFTTSNWRTQTFIPYTTWNLTTNELSTINEFNVYMYLKNESGNNVYAYFYVDEFIIDRLLSVTVSMTYRYESIFGTTSDWINYVKVLEEDVVNPGSVSWQLKAAAISTLATSIAATIPGIGYPALLIGTPITLYLQYLSFKELVDGNILFTGKIDEIQAISPSLDLKNEVDQAYRNAYPGFESTDLLNFNLFKLHLGTFNETFQTFKVKPESVQVMQMRYMTDGMVYTIEGENINTEVEVGDLTPSDTPGKHDLLSLLIDLWNEKIKPFMITNWKYVALAGVFSLFLIIPWMVKRWRKFKKGLKLMFSADGLIILLMIISVIALVYLL